MTLAFFVLIQYRSVTDRRTDGHLCSGYTSACIACYACYANALVKKYLLLVTFDFETNDNYSIRFDSIRNEINTVRTALVVRGDVLTVGRD